MLWRNECVNFLDFFRSSSEVRSGLHSRTIDLLPALRRKFTSFSLLQLAVFLL